MIKLDCSFELWFNVKQQYLESANVKIAANDKAGQFKLYQ